MTKTVIDEQEALRLINEEGEDAYLLLSEHIPGAEKRFKHIDKLLISLLRDVRNVFPDAEYYTASGGFNLLLGKSHGDGRGEPAQGELTALGGSAEIGDGDF